MGSLRQPDRAEKMEGLIRYFNLVDWWLFTFTREERNYIEATYKPLGLRVSFAHEEEAGPLTDGLMTSTSQTAAGLLWGLASWFSKGADSDIARRILEKAEELASGEKRALTLSGLKEASAQNGDVLDLHFTYQGVIEINSREARKDPAALSATISACEKQIGIAPLAARALEREYRGQPLPGHKGFQELVSIRESQGNYAEAIRTARQALAQGWAGDWQSWILDLQIGELWARAEDLLGLDDPDAAEAVVRAVKELDESKTGQICKRLGDYFLDRGADEKAFDYLNKAVVADPLIRGVQMKLKKLSRKLGLQPVSNHEARMRALAAREREAKEWWAKRDLANEYVKHGLNDKALRLFNKAIQLRVKAGGACDTIYPHMARMLEKEAKHREALLHYLLARNELLGLGIHEVPKYVAERIDRCLKKLGLVGFDSKKIFELAPQRLKPESISALIDQVIGSTQLSDVEGSCR